ncbi:hypothetical protein H8957_004384 [Semnopithecus entellus]
MILGFNSFKIPTGCSQKPSLHCSSSGSFLATDSGSFIARVPELSLACRTLSDAAVDTGLEIITKDLKEKKEVVEEVENGRGAPAKGNAREQEAGNEVDEEEEEGGEEEEEKEGNGEEEGGDEDEEAESATGKWAAKDDEDDDVYTNKQKTNKDD